MFLFTLAIDLSKSRGVKRHPGGKSLSKFVKILWIFLPLSDASQIDWFLLPEL